MAFLQLVPKPATVVPAVERLTVRLGKSYVVLLITATKGNKMRIQEDGTTIRILEGDETVVRFTEDLI